MGRILNYFQEEQTDSAAPGKNNKLHSDTGKGSAGIEIRHGQKSKSHQRLKQCRSQDEAVLIYTHLFQGLGVCPGHQPMIPVQLALLVQGRDS